MWLNSARGLSSVSCGFALMGTYARGRMQFSAAVASSSSVRQVEPVLLPLLCRIRTNMRASVITVEFHRGPEPLGSPEMQEGAVCTPSRLTTAVQSKPAHRGSREGLAVCTLVLLCLVLRYSSASLQSDTPSSASLGMTALTIAWRVSLHKIQPD